MSDFQFIVLAVVWAFALVPLALSFVLPTRLKLSAWASVIGFIPGLGGGLAFAGAWVGILGMNGGNVGRSYFEIAASSWDHLLLIAACGPAIGMIGMLTMFMHFSGKGPAAESE